MIRASRARPAASPATRVLLGCGAVAGPLFLITVVGQYATRPGFNWQLNPLSQLALGDWGWIQVTNFILAGILNLLYGVGLWRTLHGGRAGTWGPLLIGAYGLGLVVVGIFRTDPSHGFPPGVTTPAHPSWHGAVHALGALFTFLSLAAAIVVFIQFFRVRHEPGWGVYCLASAVVMLALLFTGFGSPLLMGRYLFLAALVGWMASSVIAAKLLRSSARV